MALRGNVNLNVNGLSPANIWYPLINVWKMSDEVLIFSSTAPADGNLRSDVPPKALGSSGNESAWQRLDGTIYLTADGELINPLPSDATHYGRLFETHSINILTTYTGRYGEEWVLKFDGVATSVASGLTGAVRVGNRITGTWPANQSNKQISFTGIDHNNPPTNVRFCPAVWESRLDAGELFNPDWLAEIVRGSGVIRFMGWNSTNNDRTTRTYADIPTESYFTWGGFANSTNQSSAYLKSGMPLSVCVALCEQAESHAWMCIPHVFGVSKTAKLGQTTSVAITIASPGVVTWRGHPLLADWPVKFTTTGALPTGFVAGTVYYVVGASITANAFQLSATVGGAAIDTSGTQSGTHTIQALGLTQANPPVALSQNHPFVNGDQVIPYLFDGMQQAATVTLTIASPCVVTWTGHPLQANNGVVFSGGTLPTGLTIGNAVYVKDVLSVDTFTISATPGGAAINTTGSQSGTHTATTTIARNIFTVANATTHTFELAGVNATGFSAFSGPGWLTTPYSLAGMTTQMTLLATYFRDNLRTDLITYFEFSNEAWNSIFDAFHWLAAQARAKFPNDNSYRMTGYLLAHCLKTVRDVYGVNNRTRWNGVAATFSLGRGVTDEIISGMNTYIAEQAPTLVLTDLVDDIAVVGYFGGNLEDNGTPVATTINIGTSTFSTVSNHGYLEGNPLKLSTSGTLPTPVVAGTIVYAKDVTAATYKVSATSGGAAITLGGSQAGTHTVNRVHGDLSQQWLDDSIARFNSGLETTRYAYFNRTVNEDLYDGRYSGCVFSIVHSDEILWVPNKAAADENGLGLIQYEAGNSNALTDGNHTADSTWREFFPESTQTAEDGANYTKMFTRWLALGGKYPAKFTEANPVNIFGAFGALRYPGDSNPVWDAVIGFNKRRFGIRL